MVMMDFFTGSAIFGTIAALWSKIKLLAKKLNSIFFVTVVVVNAPIRAALVVYLIDHFQCSRLGTIRISGRTEYLKPLRRSRIVGFKILPDEPIVWWQGKKPLLVKDWGEHIQLTYIRGTFDYSSFVEEALSYFSLLKNKDDQDENDRFFVRKELGTIGIQDYGKVPQSKSELVDKERSSAQSSFNLNSKYEGIPLKWGLKDLGIPRKEKAVNHLSLNDQCLIAFEEAKLWKKSEKWFKDRGIPWKRGWMLTGMQGTGKTAFARAVAQELNVPIISFYLSTMTNVDFIKAWDRTLDYLPCIILIEDIDNVFQGRKNVCSTTTVQGVTFDTFLNCIDGIDNTDGVFLIITTNHIEAVDPALGNICNGMSTRPGRIDKVITFGKLDKEGRIKMANRIFEGVDENKWKEVLDTGKNDTGAQFQLRCSLLANKLFWKENNIN